MKAAKVQTRLQRAVEPDEVSAALEASSRVPTGGCVLVLEALARVGGNSAKASSG